MRYPVFIHHGFRLLVTAALLSIGQPAVASDVRTLCDCTVRVFNGINKTRSWSGKAPEGCPAHIFVEKRGDGVFITAWISAMGYTELAEKGTVADAGKDIRSRAGRLGRCLDSFIAARDPLECRYHADKSYLVGEETGSMHEWLFWLDDNGRHAVVEYAFGDTEITPTLPADLPSGPPMYFDMLLDIHLKNGKWKQ